MQNLQEKEQVEKKKEGQEGEQCLDAEKLKGLRESIRNDPAKAKVKYHVTSSAGTSLKVTSAIERFELGQDTCQHSQCLSVIADQPKELGGQDMGPNPEELLLAALGSCLAQAFLCLATEEKLCVTKCDVKLRGKIDLRSVFDEKADVQRGFRAVIAKFDVQGEGFDSDRLHDLIRRAQLLSPVAQTVSKANKVFVCLKGEGKDIEQRFGLIGKEEVGKEPAKGEKLEKQPQQQRRGQRGSTETEHIEGYQELEGVKFLRPGESLSPQREISGQQGSKQAPQEKPMEEEKRKEPIGGKEIGGGKKGREQGKVHEKRGEQLGAAQAPASPGVGKQKEDIGRTGKVKEEGLKEQSFADVVGKKEPVEKRAQAGGAEAGGLPEAKTR